MEKWLFQYLNSEFLRPMHACSETTYNIETNFNYGPEANPDAIKREKNFLNQESAFLVFSFVSLYSPFHPCLYRM